jgi:hypothetical protein
MGMRKAITTAAAGGATGLIANLITRPAPVEKMVDTAIRLNDGTIGHTMTGTGQILNQAAIDAAAGNMPRDIALGIAAAGLGHFMGRQFSKNKK